MSRRTPRRGRRGNAPTSSSPGGPTTPMDEDTSAPISPAPAPFTTDPDMDEFVDEDGVLDEAAEFDAAVRRQGGAIVDEEEDDGEELIGDEMQQDYRRIEELDRYDAVDIDEQRYDRMTMEEREAAERDISAMETMRRRRVRLPAAILKAAGMEEEEEEEEGRPSQRRRRDAEAAAEEDDEGINLENYHGSLKTWIENEATANVIMKNLMRFLRNFMETEDEGEVYPRRIDDMAAANSRSLEVSYIHMSQEIQLLAVWLVDEPKAMLKLFDKVAKELTLERFPNYETIAPEIFVRITHLPIDENLRELRHTHLGGLVRVSGVVTRRSEVFPHLKYIRYDCGKCGGVVGPYVQIDKEKISIGQCPQCNSKGPWTINQEQTVYASYQKMTLQESPGSVPAGRVPRTMDIALLNDLIDCVRPGEEIEVTGIYQHSFERSLNVKYGFPAFATSIEANYVARKQDLNKGFELVESDMAKIRELSQLPNIQDILIESFAPSIYGHKDVKAALTLALFGGVRKDVHGKQSLRGDINVLMIGDPGTAKSQFLKYVTGTAYRAVFATGQGASAVGLTASVHKDPLTGSWTLEGGAMVLADQGVCIIDEFDKMNDQDRVSIHEAMEQQSISVSKAGIVTTLQARCAVIAAANPINGRYDPAGALMDNVELSEPILSRFDVVAVMRDVPDPLLDMRLAKHVTKTHNISHPETVRASGSRSGSGGVAVDDTRVTESGVVTISQDLLRKYIRHARTLDITLPKETEGRQSKLSKFYVSLRQRGREGGIVVTVRLVESMIRLAEASARMHLRKFVNDRDIDLAIRVVLKSFLSSQKYTRKAALQNEFRGFLSEHSDHFDFLFNMLVRQAQKELKSKALVGHMFDQQVAIEVDDFRRLVPDIDARIVDDFLKSRVFKSKFTHDARTKTIRMNDWSGV